MKTRHGEPSDAKVSRWVRERESKGRRVLLILVHALISGQRNPAIWGGIFTIVLSLFFTLFQEVEYDLAPFTISDGAFGSCFFFGTGFHGLTYIALFICFFLIFILTNLPFFFLYSSYTVTNTITTNLKNKLHLSNSISNINSFIDKNFIEWFIGFTDAEGNFNIKLTDLKENTFKYVQFTFQIGLHKDDIKVLEYIMDNLKCGHISKSGDKINYFVNDQNSLLNIIIPIFDYINLNSSKYHHYTLFKQGMMLVKNKEHLTDNGKLIIINCQKEMQNMSGKWIPKSISDKINITKYWLVGFIDGEGTFSTNKYVPRFRLENHIKELELYNKILDFIGIEDKLLYSMERKDKVNSNPTIILEINKIKDIKEKLIPLLYDNNKLLLNTLKSEDFLLWLYLIEIYYKGYHTILEGKSLFDIIKNRINKFRLSTNNITIKNLKSDLEIKTLLSELYLKDSPYDTKKGIRYYRGTDKLVSESNQIISIDNNNCKVTYKSISEAANNLGISRKKIRECLNSGKSYNNITFIFK